MITTVDHVRMLPSVEALLADYGERRPFGTADSLSGSRFEAVEGQGERLIVKYVSLDDDWIMRATGDIDCRALRLFASGILDRLPSDIDHATLALAPLRSRSGHRGAAILMRDVADLLVPEGDTRVSLETHARFIEHMAAMHAAYWDFTDEHELFPLAHHYTLLTPTMAALEAERGSGDGVPPAVSAGWRALRHAAPAAAPTLDALAADPGPLVLALQRTPMTLVHADWKFGNLGEHRDGRTVLLDWDRCGAAPPTIDIAWYCAVNCDRMPETKEAAIARYRSALEHRGVTTRGWWDAQLGLALLGGALQLAWSKTEDAQELGWWADRVVEGARLL
jgi:hypothetical protein